MAKTLTNKTLLDRRMKGLTFDGQPKTPPAAPVGMVEGLGTGTSDSNLIAASTGEYVLPEETVNQVGPDELDELVRSTTGEEPGGKPVERGLMGFSGGGRIHPSIPERPGPRPSVAAAAPVGTGLVRGAMNLLGGRRAQLEAAENKALGTESRGLRGYSMGGLIEDEELMGFNKGGFVDDFGNVDQRALGNVRNQPRTTDFGDMSQRTMAERSQQARTAAGSRMAQLNQANMNVPNTPAAPVRPAVAAPAARGLGSRVAGFLGSKTLGGVGMALAAGNAGDPNEDAWAAQQQAAIRVPGGNFLPGEDATDSGVAYAPQATPNAPGGVQAMMAAPSQAAAAAAAVPRPTTLGAQVPVQGPGGLGRISSGGDMNAANESFARANAIREGNTALRDRINFNTGGVLSRRTTPEERAAFDTGGGGGGIMKERTMFGGSDSLTGMSRKDFLQLLPSQRNAMVAAVNAEVGINAAGSGRRGDRSGSDKEKGLSPELQYRMMNDALGRERDDLKEQRKEATRLGERAEDRELSAADRDQAQRESNVKEITRMLGGDEEAGNEAYQSIVRNRQALLSTLERSGGDPERIAQLKGPMTSDELQGWLATQQLDQRLSGADGSTWRQAGVGAVAGAGAGLLRGGVTGAIAGGVGGALLGGTSGSQNAPKGEYEPGNLNALMYNAQGQRVPPQVRGDQVMFANGVSAPLSTFDDRTLRLFGIDLSPFRSTPASTRQNMDVLGANRR